MKSNVTVGPPVDLLAYDRDAFQITHQRQFGADDPDLTKIRVRWEQALRGRAAVAQYSLRVSPPAKPSRHRSRPSNWSSRSRSEQVPELQPQQKS
jgi:predicted proteasome-type protease